MKKNFTIFTLLMILLFSFWYLFFFPKKTNTLPQEDTSVAKVTYACSGKKIIAAEYFQDKSIPKPVVAGEPPVPTGKVQLSFVSGEEMTLSQTLSADGMRYANKDESFVFWGKGNGAIVLENGSEKNYKGCVQIFSQANGIVFPQIYAEKKGNFSLRLPFGYVAQPQYNYALPTDNVEKNVSAIKFSIPEELAKGTNLSGDSYLSVESIKMASATSSCVASLFSDFPVKNVDVIEDGMTYSLATSSDAGAGNRYDESIYAFPGGNSCVAIRYFIHYMAFENYPEGMVKRFDESSLLKTFDQIRSTFILNYPY